MSLAIVLYMIGIIIETPASAMPQIRKPATIFMRA
jgi:hypothetical protein